MTGTPNLIAFNKPYGVVSQFSGDGPCLADFITEPGYYPAGRLDKDSEGLLLLTNDGRLQARITQPGFGMEKTYWAQVEGVPDESALQRLRRGITLRDGKTKPAGVKVIGRPLPAREPDIRSRKHIPTSWLELTLREGRNRQVRRMTAAVGLPTLRLYRCRVGPWRVDGLAPGAYRMSRVNS